MEVITMNKYVYITGELYFDGVVFNEYSTNKWDNVKKVRFCIKDSIIEYPTDSNHNYNKVPNWYGETSYRYVNINALFPLKCWSASNSRIKSENLHNGDIVTVAMMYGDKSLIPTDIQLITSNNHSPFDR